jgi:hypothetical protein
VIRKVRFLAPQEAQTMWHHPPNDPNVQARGQSDTADSLPTRHGLARQRYMARKRERLALEASGPSAPFRCWFARVLGVLSRQMNKTWDARKT